MCLFAFVVNPTAFFWIESEKSGPAETIFCTDDLRGPPDFADLHEPILIMRRLPTSALTFLSLAAGFAVAWDTYQHAWRIPVVQNLRDAQLFCALWIIATPLAILAAALARIAAWRSTAKTAAIVLGLAAPLYGITSSFDKVRNSSRDKAVLCNIRQLAAAADQYFLENGVTEIRRLEDLVGPDKYIKALNPVLGEDYRVNFPFRQGGVLSADYPSGKILNYYPGSDFPGYKSEFAPGEIPPWRVKPRAAPVPRTGKTAPDKTGAATAALAGLSADALTRDLGKPVHKTRRGSMCASCHARKS